jgi:hypothetical protein
MSRVVARHNTPRHSALASFGLSSPAMGDLSLPIGLVTHAVLGTPSPSCASEPPFPPRKMLGRYLRPLPLPKNHRSPVFFSNFLPPPTMTCGTAAWNRQESISSFAANDE